MKNLRARGPASLEICTLLTKPGHRRLTSRPATSASSSPTSSSSATASTTRERYRNLPYIAALELEEAD